MKFRHRTHQHPGVVMLLALLLLAAVSASTIGTAITISRTTTQSSNLDNFIIASLAGDSGVERSLAVVKTSRSSSTITTAVTKINTSLAASQGVADANSRAKFQGTARAVSDPIVAPIMRTNESLSFDVLEYDGSGALQTSQARYLFVRGTASEHAGMEFSWVLLDANGEASCTGRKFVSGNTLSAGISPSLMDSTLVLNMQGDPCTELSPKGYRIKARVLDVPGYSPAEETVTNLMIETYTSGGVAAGLPGRIQIDVTGDSGASKAVKTASILWQLPVSGIFNYVLFTEGDIIPN